MQLLSPRPRLVTEQPTRPPWLMPRLTTRVSRQLSHSFSEVPVDLEVPSLVMQEECQLSSSQ